MAEKKKVPEELTIIYQDFRALEEMRDLYIDKPLGFRRAVRCQKLAKRKRYEFWRKIEELYPDTVGQGMTSDGEYLWKEEK